MFDLGWPEIMVIAIVLIVVVGPKDLPRMLRTFGRTTSKLRSMAGDFRKQFDEALQEAELDDVKSMVDDARKLDPRNEIKKHLNPIEKVGQDIRSGLDAAMKPQAAKSGPPASSKPRAAEPAKAGAARMPGENDPKTAKAARKSATSGKSRAARKPATKSRSAKSGNAKPGTATKPKTASKTRTAGAAKRSATKKTSGD
ncbi:Sec-independent protein translocase protein TatB [uncultured Nitratireductor sp.]|uniref:Sec-independent protein translocase protein TatB n=1 Tax=uncultured Nitratireductor sp. TaxID=520953 RepID=UPI0025F6F000|nr:Sec-independent protein translocase protein TatB [uncultured Nitratireductor sp.]